MQGTQYEGSGDVDTGKKRVLCHCEAFLEVRKDETTSNETEQDREHAVVLHCPRRLCVVCMHCWLEPLESMTCTKKWAGWLGQRNGLDFVGSGQHNQNCYHVTALHMEIVTHFRSNAEPKSSSCPSIQRQTTGLLLECSQAVTAAWSWIGQQGTCPG